MVGAHGNATRVAGPGAAAGKNGTAETRVPGRPDSGPARIVFARAGTAARAAPLATGGVTRKTMTAAGHEHVRTPEPDRPPVRGRATGVNAGVL